MLVPEKALGRRYGSTEGVDCFVCSESAREGVASVMVLGRCDGEVWVCLLPDIYGNC
jgi:hypothetical protein